MRGQYIAKLDNVVAEMRREKEQQKWNREENGEGTGGETDPELPFQMTKAGSNNFSAMNSHGGGSNWQDGRGGGGAGGGGVKRTVRLSFEDGDSDLGSPTRFVSGERLVQSIIIANYNLPAGILTFPHVVSTME